MFEKFNEEARRCIFMARLAASADRAKTIGQAQLLAGIRKENPLLFRGVNWTKLPLKVSELSPDVLRRVSSQTTSEIPLDAKASRALKAAPAAASKTGSDAVSSRHLLAGILTTDARLRKQMEKAGLNKDVTSVNAAKKNADGRARVFRSGIGYDLHRLVENRKLMLGGIEVPFEKGTLGHSDGDVLCHAICDALLGAASLGDIGTHFPDSDPKWRGVSSLVFLRQVRQYLERKNWAIAHIDAVVVAERPKLGPHFPAMRAAIAKSLGVAPEQVNLKAKTNEGLGELGRGEAVAAHAIATIQSRS